MQWLLILLLGDDAVGNELIVDTIKNTDLTRVSSISALIVVLYHTALKMGEQDQIKVASGMVRFTMGAHFKLRLYSQVICLRFES